MDDDCHQRAEGVLLIARLVVTTAICGAILFAAACGRPPLRVSEQARSIIIDMQSLGEYPSDVGRVRLIDANKRVVWDVKGRDEPQLGRLQLRVGENPVNVKDVRHGTYDVVAPVGKSTFTIEPGARYVIEAWGEDGKPRTKREAEFIAPRV